MAVVQQENETILFTLDCMMLSYNRYVVDKSIIPDDMRIDHLIKDNYRLKYVVYDDLPQVFVFIDDISQGVLTKKIVNRICEIYLK